MEKILFNGEILDRSSCRVDLEDRGYQFGDGIYEVIRVYDGSFFTLEEHMERLYESARKLNLTPTIHEDTLISLLEQLIVKNSIKDGILYLQWTRGVAKRQHHFPTSDGEGTLIAYTNQLERPLSQLKSGVKAKLEEDIRWLRCDIKSLNLLGNLLAKEAAVKAGCFEAILHRGKIVTEGSSSNVYIVKSGKIYTHPTSNLILEGITRKVLKKLCRANNIDFIEEEFTIEELLSAEEVMITSTTSEIMPIIQIDDKVIGDGKPGTVVTLLQECFYNGINKKTS
ncbi:D-amino-acid transaminase [Bacillus sp. 2205SS5-2]|uniref:D-amino-acid transaminase n=1 Tax=Bacillus sp. 2205SS5-2 TaxID=3109031 RepID=UPI003007A38B